MSADDRGPDFSELLRSPYDPEPDGSDGGDSGQIPWVAPVVAAIVGAVVVSGFVVYGVVRDPAPEAVEPTVTTGTQEPDPVASQSIPSGFTEVTDDVGARVERIDVSGRGTVLAVATAVRGGEDPADVPPLDPAYWVLTSDGSEIPMRAQYQEAGALGNVTVEFPPIAQFRQARLIPYLAEDTRTEEIAIELDASVPQTVTDLVIDLDGGGSVVIDELTIGDGWGWVAWSTSDGTVAKVDTVVTFLGTDDPSTPDDVDPTLLTPPHLQRLTPGIGGIPLAPPFGFGDGTPLLRVGEPLGSANSPSGIAVEFTVTSPLGVSAGPAIELQLGG